MKRTSYKKRFLLVIGIAIVLLTITYKRSVVPLIELNDSINLAEHGTVESKALTDKTVQLEYELAVYTTLLGSGKSTSETVQKDLLSLVSEQSETFNCKLIDFPGPIYTNLSGSRITTNILELQGDYPNLLRTTHALETGLKSARLVSASFYKKLDRRSRKEKMFAKLVVQHASDQI